MRKHIFMAYFVMRNKLFTEVKSALHLFGHVFTSKLVSCSVTDSKKGIFCYQCLSYRKVWDFIDSRTWLIFLVFTWFTPVAGLQSKQARVLKITVFY